jgi:hypothetical protein
MVLGKDKPRPKTSPRTRFRGCSCVSKPRVGTKNETGAVLIVTVAVVVVVTSGDGSHGGWWWLLRVR